MQLPISVSFRHPVDSSNSEYYKIIKVPMDYSKMKKKLVSGEYQTLLPLLGDLKLVRDNAVAFNGQGSLLGFVAEELFCEIKKKLLKIGSSHYKDWFISVESVLSEMKEHILNAPDEISKKNSNRMAEFEQIERETIKIKSGLDKND